MGRNTPLISNFSRGELTPKLYGRPDSPVYFQGASVMQNFMPMLQGGFTKAPGTLVVGHTVTDLAARFVPFVISQKESYVLEFTNNKIRVWNGQTSTMVQTIVSTYVTADIPDLVFSMFIPDLFITDQNYAPARLRRTALNTFALTTLTFKTATVAFTGDVTSGTKTILNVTTNLLPAETIWFLSGTGIVAGTTITSVVPTAGSSPLTYIVNTSVNANATNVGVSLTLTLQPIVFGSSGNYPRVCSVAYQRLWLANTANNPQTVTQSVVGIWDVSDPGGTTGIVGVAWSDLTSYSVPVLQQNSDGSPTTNPPTYIPTPTVVDQVNDSDAGSYTLNSALDDEILWMVNAIDMIVGSASGEWVIPATSNPNTISAHELTSRIGNSPLGATIVPGGLMFVQRLGKRVYRMNWQGANNPFEDPVDLSSASDHLFATNAITGFSIQQVPYFTIWYLRTDGSLVAFLYNPAMGVMAWWNYATLGTVKGFACIPGTDTQSVTDRDVVWLDVQRTIGGVTSNFVEQIATLDWTDQRKAVFSHCATYKTGAAFTTVAVDTGLNGATLEIVGDGAYLGTAVVSAGSLTLPKAVTFAVVGLNQVSRVQTMAIVPADQPRPDLAAIAPVWINLINSLYVRIGPDAVNLDTPPLGAVNIASANQTLFTGSILSQIQGTYSRDVYLNIVSDLPLPCTVTALQPGEQT